MGQATPETTPHDSSAPGSPGLPDGTERADVLIVGGGLVGLATAVFLARQGVRAVLAERHRSLAVHPRARGVNPRSMELLRGVGLEEAVRDTVSARALADNAGVIAVESLAGRHLGELRQSYHQDSGADYSVLSPSPWSLCHQDELEPLLHDKALELGADLRFGREVSSFTQDADGVTAVLRDLDGAEGDGAAEHRVRARYMIAADGAGSRVRSALGIPTHGPGTMARFVNIRFDADLREVLGDRRFIICYTTAAGARCALLPIDNADRWLLHVIDDREAGSPRLSEERCVELVRAAAGLPDLDVTVHDALPWDAAGLLAGRFRQGRVFLVGDAAHLMPPSGAFGSNTGLADAHNLAWKLAAVLRGQAGEALLDSYDAERRPVARATVEQAVLRSKDRPRLVGQGTAEPDPRLRPDPAVMFHYRYRSDAVVAPAPVATDPGAGADGAPDLWEDDPRAVPGTRAPHVEVELDGEKLSTVDLFGDGFVLLAAPGADWTAPARAAAEATGAAVRALTLTDAATAGPGEARAVSASWSERYAAAPGQAVLVRPDGFVAWRSDTAADAPAPEGTGARTARLTSALLRVLARDGGQRAEPAQDARAA
ncbi:FAD-dependent monooxygenase [Streptomyces sp. NPDC014773]|uniref:FAD-dependent monooxygenase n=1 Tax=Streptomyces sp. NPDC014773 TaxID=3364908 RepID=UPI0036FEF5FC